MKRASSYKTKQKEAILQYLMSRDGAHVHAACVVDGLKAAGVSIGLSTVYRYLDKLVAENQVKKFCIDNASGACYQYIGHGGSCSEQVHLKCEECGRVLHLDCDLYQEMQEHIRQQHNFCIDNRQTVLLGRCVQCGK